MQLALAMQDVGFDDPLVTDEEIHYLIAAWSHVTEEPVYLAAVVCDENVFGIVIVQCNCILDHLSRTKTNVLRKQRIGAQ